MGKEFEKHKTEKGTLLPLLNLRGKPYLQVAHRVQWFRENNPNGIITTKIIADDGKEATFKAEIYVPTQGEDVNKPLLLANAHKSETKSNFGDYREKAETGSIGRALALCGYGTQFTGGELDEGERIVDSPIQPGVKTAVTATTTPAATVKPTTAPAKTTSFKSARRKRVAKKSTTDELFE